MNTGIYLFIIVGGVLQAMGSAMNAQLYRSLHNPWLASLVSFCLIAAFFVCAFTVAHTPLPTIEDILQMPWWAPLAGLIGAVAVYAGLVLVGKVGAGAYTGLNVTAALIASIAIDHFGWLNVAVRECSGWRILGAILMIGGVTLIARF
jgi:bacterial/archaeal transporter family-2 protein